MQPVSILFVSRRGSLRSPLAQACLRHVGRGRFNAHACGVPGHVARQIDPGVLTALAAARIDAAVDAPRSWDSFKWTSEARLSLVIVLDQFAAERLPPLPGQPDFALWQIDDILAGDARNAPMASLQMLHSLRRRLEILANLPMRGLDRAALRSDVRDLADMR